MSATPLPPLPLTPSRSEQQTSAPRSGHSQHSGASFTAHLQSAQQQQSSSPDSSQTNAQQNNAQQSTSQDTSSQSSASATKPGDAKASDKTQDDAANSSDVGIDVTGGVGALVGTVLGLIEHATQAHGNTPSAGGTPSKPSTQAGNKQPDAIQAAAPVAMTPVPLPAITAAAANASAQQTSANGIADALSQKSSAFTASGNYADTSNNAGSTPNIADAATAVQSATDSAQTLAAGLTATSHASFSSVLTAATDNSTSQSTPDLAALGNLTAATPVVPTSGTAAGTHNLAMDTPVGSSGFAKELGQQVTWLSGQEVKQAQIRLNPQDLGPLDVKVSVEHGRVDVAFMTQHPATTAAVQQGLDQLHQMLGGQGLSLGHATVGQHAQQQFGAQQEQQAQSSGTGNDEGTETPLATAARVAVGLLDAFA